MAPPGHGAQAQWRVQHANIQTGGRDKHVGPRALWGLRRVSVSSPEQAEQSRGGV